MNKKYYIVFYPNFTKEEIDVYKVAKKTFQSWKKAITFKKKIEFYTGYECSLVVIYCTDNGIFRTIQTEIQNNK